MMAAEAHAEVPMTLGELLPECPREVRAQPVFDITQASGEARPGSLFIALAGRRSHGLAFAAEAVRHGATAVAWEPVEGLVAPVLPAGVIALRVPGLRSRLGVIADRFFAAPSATLKLAAITGTNGKTTVAWLVASALEHAGQPCAYVGTLGHGRPDRLTVSELTTADVLTLHRRLAAAREQGCAHAALEASSHALDQGRLDGLRLGVAAFTNLSHEHLDYHGSMAAYGAAKARLFAWPALEHAVINVDDAFGARLLATLPGSVRALAVSLNGGGRSAGQLSGRVVSSHRAGLALAWTLDADAGLIESRLLGRFNAANLLLALGILVALGAPVNAAAAQLARVRPPPGRMQVFGGAGRRPLVVVDFAHSPDALERVLEALREHCPAAKLHCVFGCGGDRDRAKRPLMGEIAGRLADRVILTDDNPRSEDGDAIIADIRSGLTAAAVSVCRDRAAAIAAAVTGAAAGDVVLVAGKGHEQTQQQGGRVVAFSDEAAVRAALELVP